MPWRTPSRRAPRRPDAAARPPRTSLVAVLGGAVFVVAVALLYGSTMASEPAGWRPAPRVHGRGLLLGPRGGPGRDRDRDDLLAVGLHRDRGPARPRPGTTGARCGSAAAVITLFGTAPLDARHFVVLPLMLLAAAALTGTIVRRMTGSASRGAFLFGFLACLFLRRAFRARTSLGRRHDLRDHGCTAWRRWRSCSRCTAWPCWVRRPATWALAAFVGSAAALILPGPRRDRPARARRRRERLGDPHRAVARRDATPARRDARLAADVRGDRHRPRRHGRLGPVDRAWHRHAAGSSPSVSPFNAFWRESVAIVVLWSRGVPRHRDRLVHGPQGALDRGRPVPRHRRAPGRPARSSGARDSATSTRSTCSSAGSPCSRRRSRRWRSVGLAAPARDGPRATGDRAARAVRDAARIRRRSSASVGWRLFGPGDHAPGPTGDPGRDPGPPARRQARLRLPAARGGGLLGRADSSASMPTPGGASCRCASRPRPSA